MKKKDLLHISQFTGVFYKAPYKILTPADPRNLMSVAVCPDFFIPVARMTENKGSRPHMCSPGSRQAGQAGQPGCWLQVKAAQGCSGLS